MEAELVTQAYGTKLPQRRDPGKPDDEEELAVAQGQCVGRPRRVAVDLDPVGAGRQSRAGHPGVILGGRASEDIHHVPPGGRERDRRGAGPAAGLEGDLPVRS